MIRPDNVCIRSGAVILPNYVTRKGVPIAHQGSAGGFENI